MTALDGPLSHAIGLAVLHLLWQGTVVATVLAIALRLLSRSSANLRYALACGALASFVAFGIGTAYRVYEPSAPYVFADEVIAPIGNEEIAGAAAGAPLSEESMLDVVQRYSSTIALIWLLGVVALATKLTISWTRARGLASVGVTPAPVEHQRTLEMLSEKLGISRAVRLLESVAVDVPSVVGFLKPVVLVPATSLSGLSARQLELILAHELAHIQRHDFLVNMLQSVAETLLFYHPAAWWVSKQIRIERENCCDDLAVATCGNALEYARALTLLEQLRSAPPLAVAANGGSLLGRVKRLVSRGDGNSINGWTAVAAAVTFAVVMTLASLPVQ
ncbi:MAG TPA: M56 family metallopeptidase, partial [Thermoanaerobaculia bacterium]